MKTSTGPPLEAGSSGLVLTCTVTEAIKGLTEVPSAVWINESSPVQSEYITGTVNATIAISTLSLPSLNTSDAGPYHCQGSLQTPAMDGSITVNSSPINITVRCESNPLTITADHLHSMPAVPTPVVSVSIPTGSLYEGTSQTLNCTATLAASVDTNITVSVQWTAPDISSSDRITISHPSTTRSPFISTLTLSPLTRADTGQYCCLVTATSSSPYITDSTPGESAQHSIVVSGMCLCD